MGRKSLNRLVVIFVTALTCVSATCNGSSSLTTVNGEIENPFSSLSGSMISVTVAGREDLTTVATLQGVGLATFELTDVPNEKTVFITSGPGFASVFSFSFVLNSVNLIPLGIVLANELEGLKMLASEKGITVNSSDGIVLGEVSQEKRTSLSGFGDISLLDGNGTKINQLTNPQSSFYGPISFVQAQTASPLNDLDLSDVVFNVPSDGRYAFFSVSPGNYTLRFSLANSEFEFIDVSVIADELTLGQNFP